MPQPMNPSDERASRRGIQQLGVVERTERLSPHLVRVHLGGPGIAELLERADPEKLASTDKYVKLLFARPELGLEPPYDLEVLREVLPLADLPVRRTYTVRAADPALGTIAIDFVVHGDEGVAGPWAANAAPGEVVALSGPGGGFAPAGPGGSGDAAPTRLLFGDDSALPAIAAALEALPTDASGLALIEVGGPADELPLIAPEGVEVRWLHRDAGKAPGETHGEPLVAAVDALDQPAGPVEVFAHGERGAIKRVRRILTDRWGLDARTISISAYWALGRAEDAFQAEKRTPIGVI
ncbi:siderophore-interacting protein [Agromyces soli]